MTVMIVSQNRVTFSFTGLDLSPTNRHLGIANLTWGYDVTLSAYILYILYFDYCLLLLNFNIFSQYVLFKQYISAV